MGWIQIQVLIVGVLSSEASKQVEPLASYVASERAIGRDVYVSKDDQEIGSDR